MDREQVKRYSLLEVALFGLLLIGMFAGWLIVKARTRVVLTEPIALEGSGVSVRLPGGIGWEHTPAWVYESDNSMALLAQWRAGRETAAEVLWRYTLAAKSGGFEESLEERLAGTPAKIEKLEMPKGALMEAVRITAPEQPTHYIAAAQLKYGRTIELQVTPKTAEYDMLYAEAVLRDTAMSLRYETPEELEAGKALSEQFLEKLQEGAGAPEAYLIKEGRGRTVGFYYVTDQAAEQEGVRRIESRHYDTQQFMMESTLQIGPAARPFEWDTRLTVPMATGVRLYKIERQEEGPLAVTSNYENEKTLYPEGAILPELMMTPYVQFWMASGAGDVVTDVLAATGALVPVRISHIAPQEAMATAEEVAKAVRVEYLHAANFFDEFYFDAESKPIGRFERQDRRPDRLWEKSDADALKKLFGEKLNMTPQETPAPKRYF